MDAWVEVLKLGGPPAIVAAMFLYYMNKRDERFAVLLQNVDAGCHKFQERLVDATEQLLKTLGRLEGTGRSGE